MTANMADECPKDIKVGDTFFLVPGIWTSQKRNVAVTKVGRRWVILDGKYRIDKSEKAISWRLCVSGDGFYSGRLWKSDQEYKDSEEHVVLFNKIKSVSRRDAKDFPIENLRQVAKLLGLDESPE